MADVGEMAPEITLPDQSGKTVTLSELRGKTVVLFFYPKASTSGCTQEACAFRDARAEFEAANAVLLGLSPDKVRAQAKFATEYDLDFPLLADTEHAIAEAYGVWGEKSLYGRKYFGILRTTFVIGPDGKIRKVFPKVKIEGHASEVLKAVREIKEA